MFHFLGKAPPKRQAQQSASAATLKGAPEADQGRVSKLQVAGDEVMALLRQAAQARERHRAHDANKLLDLAFEVVPTGQSAVRGFFPATMIPICDHQSAVTRAVGASVLSVRGRRGGV